MRQETPYKGSLYNWVDAAAAPLNPHLGDIVAAVTENNAKMDVAVAARNKAANDYLDAVYQK